MRTLSNIELNSSSCCDFCIIWCVLRENAKIVSSILLCQTVNTLKIGTPDRNHISKLNFIQLIFLNDRKVKMSILVPSVSESISYKSSKQSRSQSRSRVNAAQSLSLVSVSKKLVSSVSCLNL